MQTTSSLALDIAQTSTIASTVAIIMVAAIVGFVGLGIYRSRHTASREAQYRAMAERATDAEARFATGTESIASELKGLRVDLGAARDELAEVKQRLAGLERLLSQIG